MQIKIHLVRRDPITANGAIPGSVTANNNESLQLTQTQSSVTPNSESPSRCSSSHGVPNLPHNISLDVLNGLPPGTIQKMQSRVVTPPRSSSRLQQQPAPSGGLDSRLVAYIPESDHAAFKTAFYTVALLLFALMMGVGGWCTYKLMYAFLVPMMWAMLTGTVLFPVKMALTDTTKGWLRSLRESSTPLIVGLVMLPVSWLNVCADALWHVLTTPLLLGAIIGAFVFIKLMIYERVFLTLIDAFATVYSSVDWVLQTLASPVVIPFTIVYACVYFGWLYMTYTKRPNKKLARVLSLPIWLIVIVNCAEFTGPLRVLVFLGTTLTLALLAAGALHYDSNVASNSEENALAASVESSTSSSEPSAMGNLCLKAVFGCCAILFVARHTWVLALLSIPLVVAIKCDLGARFRLWFFGDDSDKEKQDDDTGTGTFKDSADSVSSDGSKSKPDVDYSKLSIGDKLKRLYDIMVPHALRDFAKFIFYKDQNIVAALETQMDLLSSIVVILALCIGMVFATFFVVFQIHSEAVHLGRLTGNVLAELKNGTWSAAVHFTDEQLSDHDVDEYIEQAFIQGRAWLGQQVRQLADSNDPDRADLLEGQVMQIIENLYALWEQQGANTVGVDVPQNDVWTHLSQATDLAALQRELTLIVQENVDTVLAVAQSVWGVLSSNIGFVTQLLTVILGLLLSFGMELLNIIIELVVYFTMLYYLLVCSGNQFKPIEVLSKLTIKSETDQAATSTPSDSVTAAIEQAINGVFLLSAKMSIFYGMYTWFIHNLFGLNIVFLPSILALLLAAIPLTAPSWVCFIGCAELLVRGESTAALLFLAASIAPMMFADTAFYAEVKGTHPYLTGLAIVGGMYWLGLQGAIIGPILLCCVLALVQVYTNLLT